MGKTQVLPLHYCRGTDSERLSNQTRVTQVIGGSGTNTAKPVVMPSSKVHVFLLCHPWGKPCLRLRPKTGDTDVWQVQDLENLKAASTKVSPRGALSVRTPPQSPRWCSESALVQPEGNFGLIVSWGPFLVLKRFACLVSLRQGVAMHCRWILALHSPSPAFWFWEEWEYTTAPGYKGA